MNAIISGRAGVAFLIDGDNCQAFEADAPDEIFPCAPDDYHRLFVHADDVEFLTDVDPEIVGTALRQRVAREDALDYVLYLLDVELSEETRRDAALELNGLLADSGTVEWVEDILFAKPLPESADASGALRLCGESDATVTAEFVRRLLEHQEAVTVVRDAWDRVPDEMFETLDERRAFEGCCADSGIFRRFAVAANRLESLDQVESEA